MGENSSPWQQLGNVCFNLSTFFSVMWRVISWYLCLMNYPSDYIVNARRIIMKS